MDPEPALDDLVWLFEADPCGDSEDDWQEYWPYASISFTTVRDDYTVTFSVNPGYEDAGVVLLRDAQPVVDLMLSGVESLSVEKLHGAEELVLRFRESKLAPLRLRLKPQISLTWGMNLSPPQL